MRNRTMSYSDAQGDWYKSYSADRARTAQEEVRRRKELEKIFAEIVARLLPPLAPVRSA